MIRCLFSLLLILLYNGFHNVVVCQVQNVKLPNHDDAVNNGEYTCGSRAVIVCNIKSEFIGDINQVQWVKYDGKKEKVVSSQGNGNGNSNDYIPLQLTLEEGGGLYSCQYNDESLLQIAEYTFNITITIEGSGRKCTSPTTMTPSPSSSTSTIGSHFPGLNPLIYTVVCGFLLGILILVSIITCWIRSRKNARLRALLPQETPQDYLDYIQQGQFTPLTTSEFIASLRERPPTYNESEVIQQRLTNEETSTNNPAPVPPPLPPRNSPMENDTPREPLGNINTSEGLPVYSAPPTDENTQLPRNIFSDDFTLSFLLDESSSLQQPHPVNEDEESDPAEEPSSPSETTNLLVGVIPSINNAVV